MIVVPLTPQLFSELLTNSNLDISLAENLNSRLSDYAKSTVSDLYSIDGRCGALRPLLALDLEVGMRGVPKPEPRRRALEPAICLTILTQLIIIEVIGEFTS